jgi:hypothetical protein
MSGPVAGGGRPVGLVLLLLFLELPHEIQVNGSTRRIVGRLHLARVLVHNLLFVAHLAPPPRAQGGVSRLGQATVRAVFSDVVGYGRTPPGLWCGRPPKCACLWPPRTARVCGGGAEWVRRLGGRGTVGWDHAMRGLMACGS